MRNYEMKFFEEILDDSKNRVVTDAEYEKQKYEEAERQRAEFIRTRLKQIPKRYEHETFDTYQGQNLLKDYMKTGGSLIIYGSNGTGKTHLAFASIRYQIEQGKEAFYVLAADFFNEIKQSFANGSTHKVIQDYTRYDYLVIDEIDKSYGSQTEFNYMYLLINKRYNDMVPTVLITNAKKADLVDVIGSSVLDRIAGDGKVKELSGKSYRRMG